MVPGAAYPAAPPTITPGAPPAPPAPSLREEDKAPSLPPEQTDGRRTEAGTIVLHVAQSAKVIINNRPTTSTGNHRVYRSRLEPGADYRFRIQIEDQGQVVQREIVLRAGQTKTFQLEGTELAAL